MVPNSAKWHQIVPNGNKLCRMVPNGAEWCQMVPNGAEWYCLVPEKIFVFISEKFIDPYQAVKVSVRSSTKTKIWWRISSEQLWPP